MAQSVRLGMLTPSSNTSLEPITQAMASGLPDVSVHFSRFKVTEIALSSDALAQFDDSEILRAAELLAHAKVDTIGWNGTSSAWLGFDADIRLCERITAATGIAATTSILALNEVLEKTKVSRLGFVTPYLDDVQARILKNYAGIGVACVAERHFGLRDNYSFADVTPAQIEAMALEVARDKPQAIAIVCTNLKAAPLVEELERLTGIPVYDTVATVLWKSLDLAKVDPSRVGRWGSLFSTFT
jgi:maleate isomerase